MQSDQFHQIMHNKSKIKHYNILIIIILGVFKWTLIPFRTFKKYTTEIDFWSIICDV